MMNSADRTPNRRIAPLICLACGVTMNAHAEKVIVALTAEDAGRVDAVIGGLIEEIHQCPHCGSIQSRRV